MLLRSWPSALVAGGEGLAREAYRGLPIVKIYVSIHTVGSIQIVKLYTTFFFNMHEFCKNN